MKKKILIISISILAIIVLIILGIQFIKTKGYIDKDKALEIAIKDSENEINERGLNSTRVESIKAGNRVYFNDEWKTYNEECWTVVLYYRKEDNHGNSSCKHYLISKKTGKILESDYGYLIKVYE